jgi:PEP-CTERM motif
MRKSLWIMLAILLVAIAAPSAHADSYTDYTLTFGLTDGSPNATSGGTVILDNTSGIYTTFSVDWNGVVFDFSGLFDKTLPLSAYWTGCAENAGSTCPLNGVSSCCTFVPSLSCNCGNSFPGTGFTDPTAAALGTYTLNPVAAPEPSSVALMLLGVGLVFVMRKRIGQRLPQAS